MKIHKTCRYSECKKDFFPSNSLQPYCSWKCKVAHEKEKKQDLAEKASVKLIKIPGNVTRKWFESLLPADQKRVAKILYERIRKRLFVRTLRNGNGKDAAGEMIRDPHHCWPKSIAPLWYYFQESNIIIIGRKTHVAIHNQVFEDLTEGQKIVSGEAQTKRNNCEEDEKIFQQSKKTLF